MQLDSIMPLAQELMDSPELYTVSTPSVCVRLSHNTETGTGYCGIYFFLSGPRGVMFQCHVTLYHAQVAGLRDGDRKLSKLEQECRAMTAFEFRRRLPALPGMFAHVEPKAIVNDGAADVRRVLCEVHVGSSFSRFLWRARQLAMNCFVLNGPQAERRLNFHVSIDGCEFAALPV